MTVYDWVIIGGGITGACLSYELIHQGFSVVMVEKDVTLQGATRWSYGGLAFWAAKSALMQPLYQLGEARYQQLSVELDQDIQFRQITLLMPIPIGADPQAIQVDYAQCRTSPTLISREEACALEPLLDPQQLEAALVVPHGHIQPELTTNAFREAFLRAGGEVRTDEVVALQRQGDRVTGAVLTHDTLSAAQVAVCAGGLSRAFLQQQGISMRLYFTHAELLEIPPQNEICLSTLVMPSRLTRMQMEQQASTLAMEPLWDQGGHEPVPAILDPGAIQFQDGRLRVGQISRVLTDVEAKVNAANSESHIRLGISKFLPQVAALSGKWHHCLVPFSADQLPLIGEVSTCQGLHLFTGFSNPLAVVPVLARLFVEHHCGSPHQCMDHFLPGRFLMSLR
jgi:glycine/D-amino acid oxidase-like deaminating enzyme